jgi:hypothetical protein
MDKNKKIIKEIIDKMFEIAGHSLKFEDIEGKDDWYTQWTMTEAQNKEWVEWGVKYLKKQGGVFKYTAEREMEMVNFYFGLKINE